MILRQNILSADSITIVIGGIGGIGRSIWASIRSSHRRSCLFLKPDTTAKPYYGYNGNEVLTTAFHYSPVFACIERWWRALRARGRDAKDQRTRRRDYQRPNECRVRGLSITHSHMIYRYIEQSVTQSDILWRSPVQSSRECLTATATATATTIALAIAIAGSQLSSALSAFDISV